MVYIIGAFVCMLGMVAGIVIVCYSAARRLWFPTLMGAWGTILLFTAMLDCIAGAERAYEQTVGQIVAQSYGVASHQGE